MYIRRYIVCMYVYMCMYNIAINTYVYKFYLLNYYIPKAKCIFWTSLYKPVWDPVLFSSSRECCTDFPPTSARLHLAQI